MIITRLLTTVLLLIVLFVSCREDEPESINAFKHSLITQQVGKSNYKIGLPQGYEIIESKTPQFSLYYFSPADTTKESSFSGGFCFMYSKTIDSVATNSCRVETLNTHLLNNTSQWLISDCDNHYSVQLKPNPTDNQAKDRMISAFGNARSHKDVMMLLVVYETLSKTPAY